jgi:hypothetical protein
MCILPILLYCKTPTFSYSFDNLYCTIQGKSKVLGPCAGSLPVCYMIIAHKIIHVQPTKTHFPWHIIEFLKQIKKRKIIITTTLSCVHVAIDTTNWKSLYD